MHIYVCVHRYIYKGVLITSLVVETKFPTSRVEGGKVYFSSQFAGWLQGRKAWGRALQRINSSQEAEGTRLIEASFCHLYTLSRLPGGCQTNHWTNSILAALILDCTMNQPSVTYSRSSYLWKAPL